MSEGGLGSDRRNGVAVSMRVGYALSRQVSFGVAGSLWTRTDSTTRVVFSAVAATLSVYPRGTDFVLHGGVGVGTGEAAQQQGNVRLSARERGLGLLGGLGYEFRVSRWFAFGPQVNVAWTDLDSFNADWVSIELGISLYDIDPP